MSIEWVVMPDMGRPQGRLPPVGVEHLYPDPDTPLIVELLVNKDHPEQRGQHWSISWTVGKLSNTQWVQRVLHVVREVGYAHYTNWGPKTTFFESAMREAIPIATLTHTQRQALQRIASSTEVYFPNGRWNCQDWVIEVLRQAVDEGLISVCQKDASLAAARQ